MINLPEGAFECFVIERTVAVVAHNRTYRIEAMRGRDGRFHTRVYEQHHIKALPAYWEIGTNEKTRDPDHYTVWKSIDVGWTDRSSADGAINQALGFMESMFKS